MAGIPNVANTSLSVADTNERYVTNNPIEMWPKDKKLEKLANYSACQVKIYKLNFLLSKFYLRLYVKKKVFECKCYGYKVPTNDAIKKDELCRACNHGQCKLNEILSYPYLKY